MSEHLPGVTKTVQLAVSGRSGYRRAVISGQDLEFHTCLSIANHAPTRLGCYAAR